MADFSVKKISPKLGGERGARNPNGPTSSHDLVEQMEFLYVEVIKAIKNSVNNTCFPIVEITLGNYKSSTKDLPIGPYDAEWNQVFAFDKSKGDVLSVTLKDGQLGNNILIAKKNFKLAADIPSRVPPDAKLAPQWYSMQNAETGYYMSLLMSVWFGTQADEVYSNAWFSDASDVHASCVINTRPKLYLAPRLCYVRVTIVSCHDLLSNDGKPISAVYVDAMLGQVRLKTVDSSGSNPSWNQDLLFVGSDPLDDTVYIRLIAKTDPQHEVCIGKLKKKLSEMTAVKVPGGAAPALFYDIETPSEVKPAGDTKRFRSTIKMKLATDQSYHVFDECIQYCSDYRAFAKGLWSGVLGKLEVGILGATGLPPMKHVETQRNAYVVAKYGNKWARTRTVVNNASPKWNEQYSWDIYEKCTVFTLGIYDNQQLLSNYQRNDAPIGKVRIPLNLLEWNMIYTGSFPIIVLGKEGLKKMGEIQLAFRCVCPPLSYASFTAPYRWLLPKSHYKSPLSLIQIENLRVQAVEVNCMNLARTEPPLRNEVVKDMLQPKSKNFSMRRSKANYERLYRMAMWFSSWYGWMDAKIISAPAYRPKFIAFGTCLCILWVLPYISSFVVPNCLFLLLGKILYDERNRLLQAFKRSRNPPPLALVDLKLSRLDSKLDIHELDQLAEEFDSLPSSEVDQNVVKVRYDMLRKAGVQVMLFMGDAATQGERMFALWTLCNDNIIVKICFLACCYVVFRFSYYLSFDNVVKVFLTYFAYCWVNFPWERIDLPSGLKNFYRRLPTNEYLVI